MKADAASVDHGFGRCSCGQWAIARVNTRELCADCLPGEFAIHRRRARAAAALVDQVTSGIVWRAELVAAPFRDAGHNVTPAKASEGRATRAPSSPRRKRT
ncbi:MAG: hypothetical protein ABIR60_08600 [Allosphingosinicella sp.]